MYQQALLTTVNYIQPTYISIGRKVSSVNYGILTGFELVFEIRCNFDILEFDAKLLILAIWLVRIAKFRVFFCEKSILFLTQSPWPTTPKHDHCGPAVSMPLMMRYSGWRRPCALGPFSWQFDIAKNQQLPSERKPTSFFVFKIFMSPRPRSFHSGGLHSRAYRYNFPLKI